MTKKLHIKTYGCQMNVYDSSRMGDVLAPLGYELSDDVEDADLVLLNPCHIREKAAEKVYSELGRIRELRDERAANGKTMLIGVAGCVAQAEGEEVMRRAPYVDMVVGSHSYHQLPEMVTKALRREGGVVELDFPEVQKFDLLPEQVSTKGSSAFVSVQEGCDKFCTFCVVPYTRGGEYSRPVAAVLDEVKKHIAQGALEITLLGQNVNAYHGEATDGSEWNFGRLMFALAELDGLKRIRYTTSHPRDMHDELFRAHAEIPQLMPYLHLPVQSGSDTILKAMNRKHKAADYLALIDKLRAARADIAFSSDFIVGFPGESDKDFEATMKLVEMVGFASAFSFKYSPRPGTPAASDDRQIDEAVKVERLAQLQALLLKQQEVFNATKLGARMQVLLEREGRQKGQLIGKSPYMQSVVLEDAIHLMNKLVEVEITQTHVNSLKGVLVA